jgi:hypothetical protein
MQDEDIGRLWTDNYPYRNTGATAFLICRLIKTIVQERARWKTTSNGSSDKIIFALRDFNISVEQWNDF